MSSPLNLIAQGSFISDGIFENIALRAAPTYFTQLNAVAEEARIADRPRAAANTCTIAPEQTPREDAIPILPPLRLFLRECRLYQGRAIY